MTEIHLFKRTSVRYKDRYYWRLLSRNGKFLAQSTMYKTKFHCKAMAQWLFPTFKLIDNTKDRRRRA